VGDVVPLDIQPKTLKRTYKRHHFTVTYTPKTGKWKWSVEVQITTKYSEEADTMQKAIRAAEKCIDQCLQAQGKVTF
jgi:ribosomal protein L16/L10AE